MIYGESFELNNCQAFLAKDMRGKCQAEIGLQKYEMTVTGKKDGRTAARESVTVTDKKFFSEFFFQDALPRQRGWLTRATKHLKELALIIIDYGYALNILDNCYCY